MVLESLRFRYHQLLRLRHKLIRRGKWAYSLLRELFEGPPALSSEEQTVFLLSTGRTGTTFMGTVLNRAPGLVARHEPQPDCFDLGVKFGEGRAPVGFVRRILRANRWWVPNLLKENNARIYFESNQYLFSLVPVLQDIFPGSKFIRVVRDGRDVVRSFFARDLYASSSKYDYPRPDRIEEEPWGDEWEEMTRFERIAWYWQFKDRYIQNSLTDLPSDSALNLKFEDIYDESRNYPGMRSLLGYLGIEDVNWKPWMDRSVRSTTQHELLPWPEWGKKRRERFNRIAGEHLENCGYSWD